MPKARTMSIIWSTTKKSVSFNCKSPRYNIFNLTSSQCGCDYISNEYNTQRSPITERSWMVWCHTSSLASYSTTPGNPTLVTGSKRTSRSCQPPPVPGNKNCRPNGISRLNVRCDRNGCDLGIANILTPSQRPSCVASSMAVERKEAHVGRTDPFPLSDRRS